MYKDRKLQDRIGIQMSQV
jgi:hypothetical protein